MASRKSPEEREITLNQASQEAIKQRFGNVTFENAKEEYTSDEPELVTPLPAIIESFEKEVAITAAIPVETNTYGSNYYLIDSESLPTRGRFYNGAKIFLRNFKVVEVKRLAYIDEDSADGVINDIMEHVVKGISWKKLKTADRIAIIFYVRMNTFPDPAYKINYACNNKIGEGKAEKVCGATNKMSFTPNDLNMKYLPEDFKMSDQIITLPNGDTVQWRFPEIIDEQEIKVATEQIKFAFEKDAELKGTEVDVDVVSLSHLIVAINNETVNDIEKYLYVSELAGPTGYVIILREISAKFDIGLDPTVECICSECGGRVSVPVMFSPEFFLPEYSA